MSDELDHFNAAQAQNQGQNQGPSNAEIPPEIPDKYEGIDGWGTNTQMSSDGTANGGSAFMYTFPKESVYTVQFNLALPQSHKVVLEALLTFTQRGIVNTRRVSVASGTSIQVPCKGLTIQLIDKTGDAGAFNVITYNVGILATKGTRAPTPAPPIYVPDAYGTINASSTVTLTVPLDAGANAFYVAVSSSAPVAENAIQVEQKTPAGTLQAIADPRVFQWIPLIPGTSFIQIANNGTTIVDYRLVYAIDG
jgi:hypothetical protein